MPGLHSPGGSSGTFQMLLLQIQPYLLPKLHHMEANKALPPSRDLSWQTPCTQQGLLIKAASRVWGGTGCWPLSTGMVALHLWLPTCLLTTQIFKEEHPCSLFSFPPVSWSVSFLRKNQRIVEKTSQNSYRKVFSKHTTQCPVTACAHGLPLC